MTTQSDSANVESQTITARAEWGIPGGYFKLLSAGAAVTLELYRGGRRVLFAAGATAGFYQKIDFDKIVITPSGSTAISFIAAPDEAGVDSLVIGSPLLGDNADNVAGAGAGALVGTVARLMGYTNDGATWSRIRTSRDDADARNPVLAGQEGAMIAAARMWGYNGASFDRLRADAIGGAGALRVTDRGYAFGASGLHNTLLGALGSVQFFSNVANANGAIVWSGEISASCAAANTWALLAKTGAVVPGSVGDGDPLLTVACLAGGLATGRIERPVFIPAGKSVYVISTGAEATISIKSIKYTLL